MKISVKDAVCRTLLMSALIFTGANFTVFGQENKSEESQLGRLLLGNSATPQPTPKATKPTTRERKVNTEDASADRQTESYQTSPLPDLQSTSDYPQETEIYQEEIQTNKRNQDAGAPE